MRGTVTSMARAHGARRLVSAYFQASAGMLCCSVTDSNHSHLLKRYSEVLVRVEFCYGAR